MNIRVQSINLNYIASSILMESIGYIDLAPPVERAPCMFATRTKEKQKKG